jgi:Short C-terminal domain
MPGRRGPVVVQRNNRPGLVGTMARTAVIAGTATVAVKGVSGAMSGGQKQAAAQQQAASQQQQAATQQQMADLQANQQALAQQQAMLAQQQAMLAQQPAPGAMSNEKFDQLQKLGQLQAAGVLTDEEFAAQKAKILAS